MYGKSNSSKKDSTGAGAQRGKCAVPPCKKPKGYGGTKNSTHIRKQPK